MPRQFFNTLVGMGSRSHDFDDELKISFLISSSDARSKTFILDLISGFCTCGIFCTLYNVRPSSQRLVQDEAGIA